MSWEAHQELGELLGCLQLRQVGQRRAVQHQHHRAGHQRRVEDLVRVHQLAGRGGLDGVAAGELAVQLRSTEVHGAAQHSISTAQHVSVAQRDDQLMRAPALSAAQPAPRSCAAG